MPRRLTQDEFIERARSVHGDKYDYSNVEYESLSMKVCIICPEHGEFWQRAGQHLDGNGCPKCAHINRAKTCLERYGIAHPCASAESLKKAKLTVRDKYGVDNVFQCDSIKAKIRQTNMERYGVENPMQSATILAKAQATNVEKYGVPCSMQAESVKHKHRQSVFKKYGVENSMCVPEVRAKAVQTCLEHYGVANPRCSPIIDEKIRNTCMERYGVPYVVESADVRAKSEMSKRERGTFNSSRPAGVMKTILCDIFGNDNVRSEYD